MNQERSAPGWQNLLQRLGKVTAAMDESHVQTDIRTRQMLDARAKQIAVAQRDRAQEPGIEAVTFRIGRQRCAISTSFVFEVLPLPSCTPLPGVPAHFVGMCSLRGQILLVADLSPLFDFAAADAMDSVQLLILGTERPELGILAAGACQTAQLLAASISAPQELSTLPIGNCARGVTRDGIVLLDGRVLLTDPRLFINQAGEERQT